MLMMVVAVVVMMVMMVAMVVGGLVLMVVIVVVVVATVVNHGMAWRNGGMAERRTGKHRAGVVVTVTVRMCAHVPTHPLKCVRVRDLELRP